MTCVESVIATAIAKKIKANKHTHTHIRLREFDQFLLPGGWWAPSKTQLGREEAIRAPANLAVFPRVSLRYVQNTTVERKGAKLS